MTKINEKELRDIIASARDMEELNKLTRISELYFREMNTKLQTIWILKSKLEKIDDKLQEILYGK